MEPLTFSHEIGIAAGICLVLAYGLMNFGVLTTSSPLYQTLNVLGALGFAYTAFAPFNPGLLITEIVWAVVAVAFLWKIFARKNTDATEPDEAAETQSAETAAAEAEMTETAVTETEPALESVSTQ